MEFKSSDFKRMPFIQVVITYLYRPIVFSCCLFDNWLTHACADVSLILCAKTLFSIKTFMVASATETKKS